MARLKVYPKSAAGRDFPVTTRIVDAFVGMPSAGPIIFDNPTPEQIEAFGLAPREEPPAEPEPAPKRRKR